MGRGKSRCPLSAVTLDGRFLHILEFLRSKEIKIVGYISRPVVGEGRQAPDRQVFFVNGRPCILPQVCFGVANDCW